MYGYDKLTAFGDNLVLHANIGNAILGDVIDLESTKGKAVLGAANPSVVAYLREVIDSAGDDTTIKIDIRCADDAALTTNPVDLFTTGVMTQASLQTLNMKIFETPFPKVPAGKRYVGLWLTVATGNCTTGHAEIFVIPLVPSFPIAS